MYGREELESQTICAYGGDGEMYEKEDADNVMDAMEARIKHLESILDLDPRTNLSLVDENQQLRSRIKEIEMRLEDTQNTMATENTDLGMENHKLKERIKELEKSNDVLNAEYDLLKSASEEKIKELESQLPKWKVLNNLAPKNKYLKFLSVKENGKRKINVGFVREGIFGVDVVLLEGSSVLSKSFNKLKGKIFYLEETLPSAPTTEDSSATEKEK